MSRLHARLRQYTRGRRNTRFRSFLADMRRSKPDALIRVLDIGGTVPFWQAWNVTEEDRLQITLVNNHVSDDSADVASDSPFLINYRHDAMTLTPGDFRSFDLVFSNSCIEHLRSRQDQFEMARRINESGLPYFIQVPNKYAPVDPHIPRPYLPFFGAYPKPVQARILVLKSFNPNGEKPASIEEAYETFLNYYNPLGMRDVRRLFPEATISMERPFGVPMSILAYRGSLGGID